MLAKSLKRGKIDCTMHLRGAQAGERELRIDASALGAWPAAVGQVLSAGAIGDGGRGRSAALAGRGGDRDRRMRKPC